MIKPQYMRTTVGFVTLEDDHSGERITFLNLDRSPQPNRTGAYYNHVKSFDIRHRSLQGLTTDRFRRYVRIGSRLTYSI
jgi:hypothetical protein